MREGNKQTTLEVLVVCEMMYDLDTMERAVTLKGNVTQSTREGSLLE